MVKALKNLKAKKISAKKIQGNKNKIFLALAIVLALISGFGIYSAFKSVYQPVTVIAANKDLKANHKIKNIDLVEVEMSKRDVHPSAITSKEQVTGKYTNMPVAKDEVILTQKLLKENQEQFLDLQNIAPDEITIKLDSSEDNVVVPDSLQKGDFISLWFLREGKITEMAKGSRFMTVKSDRGFKDELTSFLNVTDNNSSGNERIIILCKREEAKKVLETKAGADQVYIVSEDAETLNEENRVGLENLPE